MGLLRKRRNKFLRCPKHNPRIGKAAALGSCWKEEDEAKNEKRPHCLSLATWRGGALERKNEAQGVREAFLVEIEEKENQFFGVILEGGLTYKAACLYFFCKLLCCAWDSGKEKCIISAKG